MISGVSLLDAECGALLLCQTSSREWMPVSLPLFGCYQGRGIPEELDEGPGALLLVQALERQEAAGALSIDIPRLGIPAPRLDDLESVFEVLAVATIHAPSAITLSGFPLSFCLFSAHVAASLMEGSPAWLDEVPLENIAERVFTERPNLYDGLSSTPFRLRCRFGLSFAALCSLDEELRLRRVPYHPPRYEEPQSERLRERWLESALRRAKNDELLTSGLAHYLAERQRTGDSQEDGVAEEELTEEDE